MRILAQLCLLSLLGLSALASIHPVQAAELDNAANIARIQSALADSNGRFSFVVIGDSRSGDRTYTALLEQLIELDPLFVLHTGDLVYNGSPDEFRHYAWLVKPLPLPLVHVVGNHDIRDSPEMFVERIGELNWSFDAGGCRFISLDNSSYRFDQATIDFARHKLDTELTTFVLMHLPPSIGRWQAHSMYTDERGGRGSEVVELLASRHPRQAYLGHIHLYDEMVIDGVEYIICGGGGAPLATKYGFGKPEYGFLLVSVDNGMVDSRWIPLRIQ